MSFWSAETLEKRLPTLVKPFNPDAIDCAAYTLRIGCELYISPDGSIKGPDTHTKRTLDKDKCFAIPPGQFAFLLTLEEVQVPDNAIAFISIKGRMKFKGLINISGFHVDPGYKGRLVFSVLNAGPRPIHFQQGQEVFLIWYADLDCSTTHGRSKAGFTHIDPELINGISGEILSLQSLSEKQRILQSQIDDQRNRIKIFIGLGIGIIAVLIGILISGLIPITTSDLWKYFL